MSIRKDVGEMIKKVAIIPASVAQSTEEAEDVIATLADDIINRVFSDLNATIGQGAEFYLQSRRRASDGTMVTLNRPVKVRVTKVEGDILEVHAENSIIFYQPASNVIHLKMRQLHEVE